MDVGIMRNSENPTKLCRLTAKMGKYYNIDFIYLRPKDIDITSKKVTGKMLIDDKWQKKTCDLPKLIDISPYCFKVKNRKVTRYLKKNCYLTDNRENLVNKKKLHELLLTDDQLSQFVIPTKDIENFESIMHALDEFNTIEMKPIRYGEEKGRCILTRYGTKYMLDSQKKKSMITEQELKSLFQERFSKRYIIQKYIHSRSEKGNPFDCRIHFEKNGLGNWAIAKMYVRIDINQKGVLNKSQGGATANTMQFLKVNFSSKWNDIYAKLKKLADIFPYKFERFRKTDIMSLAINVGIDKDGRVFIFEVNSAPAINNIMAEVVDLRTQYYKYLLDNKVEAALKRKRNVKLVDLAGRKFGPSDRLVIREAYKRGVKFRILPQKKFKMEHGKSSYTIYPGMIALSLNSAMSNKIALMKDETNNLLRNNGYPAPENRVYSKNDVEKAWEWAKTTLPVVLKPIDGQMGNLVFVKIDNRNEFIKSFDKISLKHDRVLVEEFKTGQEYRFAYVNNEIVAIARRIPANVSGDGARTVGELMEQKNMERKRRKNPIHKPLLFNEETERVLGKQGKDYEYIPLKGEIVYLRNNSNISTSGDAIDVTDNIDVSTKELVREAINIVPGIEVCGADVLIDGNEINIIEINTNPMISLHHFPWRGKKRLVANKIVDAMFPETITLRNNIK